MGLSLDRSNFANAMTDNLLNDLKLTTNDYNNVLPSWPCDRSTQLTRLLQGRYYSNCVLFVRRLSNPATYEEIWFQTSLTTSHDCLECCRSANSAVQLRNWLTILSIALSQAGMHGRASFYAARGLKGIFEAGFIPSSIFCASQFYKSKEFSLRLSIFFASMNVCTPPIRVLKLAKYLVRPRPILPPGCWYTPHAWRLWLGWMALAVLARRDLHTIDWGHCRLKRIPHVCHLTLTDIVHLSELVLPPFIAYWDQKGFVAKTVVQ